MNCPECGQQMKHRVEMRFDPFYEDDLEYCPGCCSLYYPDNLYSCSKCKIKYQDSCYTSGWDIPEHLQPTRKQEVAIGIIQRNLGTDEDIVTKKQAIRFIGENMEKSKKQSDKDFEFWCEENADWLPEYY